MAKHNLVACRHTQYGTMLVRCNKVYVNDSRAVKRWRETHEHVTQLAFEHGDVYMAKCGDSIVSIDLYDTVKVAAIGEEAVWFIE